MSQHHFLPGTHEDFKRAIDDVNRKMQEDEARAKASALGVPYLDLYNFPIDLNVLALFSKEEAESLKAVPFFKDQADLRVGAVEPFSPELVKKLKVISAKNKISVYL